MRYDPQDRLYPTESALKKGVGAKSLQRNSKSQRTTSEIRYIAVDAIVTSRPRNECTIFQKRSRTAQSSKEFHMHNREEVVVTGNIHIGGSSEPYIIRFVHKRCIEAARKLTVGARIYVEKGYFNYRPGRKNCEFWVKSFREIESQYPLETATTGSRVHQTVERRDISETDTYVPEIDPSEVQPREKRPVKSNQHQIRTEPLKTHRTPANEILVALTQLGFGWRFTTSDLLSSQPNFLHSRYGSELPLLNQRLRHPHDTFAQLREIVRYIFSDGGRHPNSTWREEYENGQWRHPQMNPGLLADAWLASRSQHYRLAVGNSLVPIVYKRFSNMETEFYYSMERDNFESDSDESRIETALSEAGIAWIQRTELPGCEWRFPFSPETLTELCLYPLSLPRNLATSFAAVNPGQDGQQYLSDCRDAVISSRKHSEQDFLGTPWALNTLLNDGALSLAEAEERLLRCNAFDLSQN